MITTEKIVEKWLEAARKHDERAKILEKVGKPNEAQREREAANRARANARKWGEGEGMTRCSWMSKPF